MELLVSMAILALLLALMAGMVNATINLWREASARSSSFTQAREAFDAITAQLAEVTLQPYWDYVDANGQVRDGGGSFVPVRVARQSDLHFLMGPAAGILGADESHPGHAVFFQKSGGEDATGTRPLKNLLATAGFFLEVGDSGDYLPAVLRERLRLGGKKRFRLVEVEALPADTAIYESTANGGYSTQWITGLDLGDPSQRGQKAAKRIAAENIVLLVLRPRLDAGQDPAGNALTRDYTYDSRLWAKPGGGELAEITRNQLPPIIDVLMVAIDEASADRLDRQGKMTPAGLGLESLFSEAGNEALEADLKTLETALVSLRVTYRVFRASVAIANARWGEA